LSPSLSTLPRPSFFSGWLSPAEFRRAQSCTPRCGCFTRPFVPPPKKRIFSSAHFPRASQPFSLLPVDKGRVVMKNDRDIRSHAACFFFSGHPLPLPRSPIPRRCRDTKPVRDWFFSYVSLKWFEGFLASFYRFSSCVFCTPFSPASPDHIVLRKSCR